MPILKRFSVFVFAMTADLDDVAKIIAALEASRHPGKSPDAVVHDRHKERALAALSTAREVDAVARALYGSAPQPATWQAASAEVREGFFEEASVIITWIDAYRRK
jgi:hypothetical protein